MRERRADTMTKITIFSGFLGAGKTTLIKKLISEAYTGEKLVLIENEFGQIGIDGGFLQDAGVEITEMNSGCICCSLVGDFGKALLQVLEQYHPDRIIIEPSGVGKLSDVIRAVQNIHAHDVELDGFTTVVDAKKCKMYQKNFGEFFNNQITYASCLILSHTAGLSQEKLDDCVHRLRACNEKAPIVTTDWDKLTGAQLLDAMTQKNTLNCRRCWKRRQSMTITIIMITTMKKNMIMNTNITTTMITMNTSMSMNMAKTAPAAAMTTITTTSTSITTIMRMMYSPAGAWNLRKPIPRKRSQPHWKRSRMQAPMA